MKGNFKRGSSGKSRIIAVDFDGTVVKHKYPQLGGELPNATDVLNRLVKAGHKLILLTMRDYFRLRQAIQWFKDRNVYIWAVNENPDQHKWASSAKIYADLYIDDLALGCPMNKNGVDWYKVEVMLENGGFFSGEENRNKISAQEKAESAAEEKVFYVSKEEDPIGPH